MAFPIGWNKKAKLTIDHTKVSGSANLSDFPVLLTEANFPAGAFLNSQNGGADLRFSSDIDGTTQLAHEVVNWDTVNSKAEVWVKIPTVSYTADTDFYVWYDNDSATPLARTDTYGSDNVWDSNYKLVLHLNGNPNDSTSNSYNGTNVNNTYDETYGKYGSGSDFNGTSAKITASNALNLPANYTLETWINPDALPSSGVFANIFGKYYTTNDAGGTPGGYEFRLYNDSGTQRIDMGHYNGSLLNTEYTLSTGVWSHLVGTWDGTNFEVYVNGTSIGTGATASGNAQNTTKILNIGAFGLLNNAENGRWFNGKLDEVRISSTNRSDGWVATEYANQSSPATFVIEGAQESSSVSPSISPSPSSSLSPSASISPSSSISSSPSSSESASISPSSSSSASISPSSSISKSPSPSSSISSSPSPSISLSVSPSISASPSVGYKEYSRGDYASLPTNDTTLETSYSSQDLTDVSSKNDVRVGQTATGEYAIHQYKDFVSGEVSSVNIETELQSNLAPSSSAVYLQVYNRVSSEWETLDSNNSASANTDFTLSYALSSLENFKDEHGVISCRVYQLSV
jgi:hypothetical protein